MRGKEILFKTARIVVFVMIGPAVLLVVLHLIDDLVLGNVMGHWLDPLAKFSINMVAIGFVLAILLSMPSKN